MMYTHIVDSVSSKTVILCSVISGPCLDAEKTGKLLWLSSPVKIICNVHHQTQAQNWDLWTNTYSKIIMVTSILQKKKTFIAGA